MPKMRGGIITMDKTVKELIKERKDEEKREYERLKPSFEEYLKIANTLKDIRSIQYRYPHILNKTSEYEKLRWKAEKALDNLRCYLEDLMFLDYREELSKLKDEQGRVNFEMATHVFYDCSQRFDVATKQAYRC